MFSIGWTELLVIGIVALIVVGPKDLPGMFRALGKVTAKARRMARDFQRAMEDAADEAGVKDVAKDLNAMTNPKKMGLDALNEAADKFDKWQPPSPGAARKRGPETQKMTEERAEAARKIHEESAKKAAEKRAAEAAAADEIADASTEAPAPETDKT